MKDLRKKEKKNWKNRGGSIKPVGGIQKLLAWLHGQTLWWIGQHRLPCSLPASLLPSRIPSILQSSPLSNHNIYSHNFSPNHFFIFVLTILSLAV